MNKKLLQTYKKGRSSFWVFSIFMAIIVVVSLLLINAPLAQAAETGITTIPITDNFNDNTGDMTYFSSNDGSKTWIDTEETEGVANSADSTPNPSNIISSMSSTQSGPPPTGETLLESHFGVTLTLQSTFNATAGYDDGSGSGPNGGYMFDHTSFVPTKNVATTDWIEGDWFGTWDNNFGHSTIQHTPAPGTPDLDYYSSGGEWYDVEAMYLDNDADYFYFAIVTSVPFIVTTAPDGTPITPDVGIVDPRLDATRAFIRPGDLSINLFEAGTTRNEASGTTWNYNYGLNLIDEIRPNNNNTNEDIVTLDGNDYTTQYMRSNALGAGLFSTTSDLPASATNVIYPTVGDWYTGSRNGHTDAYFEHTNFDPDASGAQFTDLFLGNAAYVAYYQYTFPSGHEENDAPTYIVEAVVPRSHFGANDPGDGDPIGMQWVEGCRNDGDVLDPVLELVGDVDTLYDFGDLPDTAVGTSAGNYNTTSSDSGPSHAIDNVTYLGSCVDAEADGQPDTEATGDDGTGGTASGTCAVAGDDEDGVTIPSFGDPIWDGARANLDVSVSADSCLNIWIDFGDGTTNNPMPDGDFTDTGEHVLVNEPVSSSDTSVTIDIPTWAFDPNYTGNRNPYLRARLTPRDSGGGCASAEAYGGTASPLGLATGGEVEDYKMSFGPTAVTLQDIRVSTNSSLLAVSIAGFMMLALVSFGLSRFRTVLIRRK